jgi:hypothetical protein
VLRITECIAEIARAPNSSVGTKEADGLDVGLFIYFVSWTDAKLQIYNNVPLLSSTDESLKPLLRKGRKRKGILGTLIAVSERFVNDETVSIPLKRILLECVPI